MPLPPLSITLVRHITAGFALPKPCRSALSQPGKPAEAVKKSWVVLRRTKGGQGCASCVAESYSTQKLSSVEAQIGSRLLGDTQKRRVYSYAESKPGTAQIRIGRSTLPRSAPKVGAQSPSRSIPGAARDARDLVQFVALAEGGTGTELAGDVRDRSHFHSVNASTSVQFELTQTQDEDRSGSVAA
ncbi:hypothetical protein DFH08DRAFT_803323 [Mycena albidolilacea]|uniref:Uncharacterized protein n=1 Tax=Mycena albidolilacea TaxID=1033008 RepID=A0AAD7EXA5_9AGAR|nr:hypothetical protein DFH08DRAFT_803323 [Mycena albidolilacea]